VRFPGFGLFHSIIDVPEDTLIRADFPREELLILDPRLRGVKEGGREATVEKYWREIAAAWGDESLSASGILSEFRKRRVIGWIMFRGGVRDRADGASLEIQLPPANAR
jgi:hypothetical protein